MFDYVFRWGLFLKPTHDDDLRQDSRVGTKMYVHPTEVKKKTRNSKPTYDYDLRQDSRLEKIKDKLLEQKKRSPSGKRFVFLNNFNQHLESF